MYITVGETPCTTHDAEIWFSDRNDSKRTRTAKALCRVCPERLSCLSSVERYEDRVGLVQPGVYAGLTHDERVARRQRRQGTVVPDLTA